MKDRDVAGDDGQALAGGFDEGQAEAFGVGGAASSAVDWAYNRMSRASLAFSSQNSRSLTQEFIVGSMTPYPEPLNTFWNRYAQSTIVNADTYTTEAAG